MLVDEFATAKNKTQLKAMMTKNGWSSKTVVWDWHALYGFDPILDVMIDGMHCFGGVVRDLLRATIDGMLSIPGMKAFSIVECLRVFKISMPGELRHGRRFPRQITHEALASWTHEELLIWIRIGWRHFFACMWTTEMRQWDVDVMTQLQEAWHLLEEFILAVLDRRGLQGTTNELRNKANM